MADKATRRSFLIGAPSAATLAAPAVFARSAGGKARHNLASFRAESWLNHFDNLKKGAILADPGLPQRIGPGPNNPQGSTRCI